MNIPEVDGVDMDPEGMLHLTSSAGR
jgi:hypothetical protein